MSHDCDEGTCRRDFLKKGALGLTYGFFGLSVLSRFFLEEAYGITPDPTYQKYDAVIQIFYAGGPPQIDTFDAKPGSANMLYKPIDIGVNDIYGKKIYLTDQVSKIATAVTSDPAIKMGLVRSLHHISGDHDMASRFMHCFWQSPVQALYPTVPCVMAHYFKDQTALKIPSVVIDFAQANDPKGGDCPTGFPTRYFGATVGMLTEPVADDRYQRRKAVADAFNASYLATRPDPAARAWDEAARQAYDVTRTGLAKSAFDLTGKTILPGGTKGNADWLSKLTQAQELVKAGVPYVTVEVGSNDSHTLHDARTSEAWRETTDPAVAQMVKNLKATGKRVLIVMGGEFGRTPQIDKTAPANGDGRNHWPGSFTWTLISINQPSFKMTAVGDTGPDGMFAADTKDLVDPIAPGVMGAFLYRSLGFPVGTDPKWDVPTVQGMRCPVDTTMATSPTRGNAPWLLGQFGLA